MSNLTISEFTTIGISGNKYLCRVLDAEIHLNAMNLGEIVTDKIKHPSGTVKKQLFFSLPPI